jgi:hypothetical protein
MKVNELIGKIVEIETGDVKYAGRLIEIGEEEVHIESETGWIVLPIEVIALIREKKDD